jgi:hypothetical protein
MINLPPWIGLAIVLVGAPIINWLCRPPRRVKHYPTRDDCGSCGAPWTDGHRCGPVAVMHWPQQDVCGSCGAPWTSEHRCGPVTVTHWPRLDVCGSCGAPWSDNHRCSTGALDDDEQSLADDEQPLTGDLRRLRSGIDLERRPVAQPPGLRRHGDVERRWPPPAA